MQSKLDAEYGLKMTEGYLEEARKTIMEGAWWRCVSYSQLSVENAVKAIIACFGTPSWTHNPKNELEIVIKSNLQTIKTKLGNKIIDFLNKRER